MCYEKGTGSVLAELGATVVGTVSCLNCSTEYLQQDVISGKYDTTEIPEKGHLLRRADAELKFFVGDRVAWWGAVHTVAFNQDWAEGELSWLLDGGLLPASRNFTMAELRKTIEGNFPIAYNICVAANKMAGRQQPEQEAEAYTLVIQKFYLSYAVRNDVPFATAQSAYKRVMDKG